VAKYWVCGLLGSGRTELALSLFGIIIPIAARSSLMVNRYRSKKQAREMGIAYVSEDRLTLGAILPQSVADNMVISILDEIKHRGI
jgi:simple sugar transport system ATP-binding protein